MLKSLTGPEAREAVGQDGGSWWGGQFMQPQVAVMLSRTVSPWGWGRERGKDQRTEKSDRPVGKNRLSSG